MPDIIQLLPESVANQIAAGEVVQRPASVVKELLENSIDASADLIKLVVKDAGKTLIQVTDNGTGMTETDARMCFERHATSKIKRTDDLFHIVTKGFRGEALASIAAVAQVELKTKSHGTQLGTLVEAENSRIVRHELISCPEGTTFIVKNLFYNVPARRYFLKSDPIELRHIVEEFQRVALTHPEVAFSFIHNGTEVFNLPVTQLRQRIVHVFGNRYNEKLVPVEETTDIVAVNGFVGKPDAARKTRGEQFFFVNNRFIRNGYLHHAVMSAFEGLLPQGHFPFYLLYMTVDPALIDINIHPTKTEIKFQDERAVYAILHASIRRALGRFNIAPTIDFDQEISMNVAPLRKDSIVNPPVVRVNQDYNPFESVSPKKEFSANWFDNRPTARDWEELKDIRKSISISPEQERLDRNEASDYPSDDKVYIQLYRKYIVVPGTDGMILVDQQRAHQRILFEQYMAWITKGNGSSQQVLFPELVSLSATNYALILESMDDLGKLGLQFVPAGNNEIEILGVPADAGARDPHKLIDEMLEQLANESAINYSPREKLAWAMARSTSIRYGQMLTPPEMSALVKNLMSCQMPRYTLSGMPVMITFTHDQLDQFFR